MFCCNLNKIIIIEIIFKIIYLLLLLLLLLLIFYYYYTLNISLISVPRPGPNSINLKFFGFPIDSYIAIHQTPIN